MMTITKVATDYGIESIVCTSSLHSASFCKTPLNVYGLRRNPPPACLLLSGYHQLHRRLLGKPSRNAAQPNLSVIPFHFATSQFLLKCISMAAEATHLVDPLLFCGPMQMAWFTMAASALVLCKLIPLALIILVLHGQTQTRRNLADSSGQGLVACSVATRRTAVAA